MPAPIAPTPSYVPIIDVGGLYTSDPARKAAVAQQIGEACD